jgi:hypothetical protein
MLRVAIVVGVLISLAASLHAQNSASGTQEGDTVSIIVHHVRADKRAQYDSLMQNVWNPAAKRAGEKYPEYGKAFAARRRYVPTEMQPDSTYTYVYLYSIRAAVPKSPAGGNYVLAAAGVSKAESDAYSAAMRSYLAPGSGSQTLVDTSYR